MPAPGTPYTAAELQRAVALQAKDLTWAQIALILGRPRGSLKVTVCRYRMGTNRSSLERAAVNREIAKVLVHAVTVEGVVLGKVLAHRVGLSLTSTHRRLARLGLDSRTRRIAARAAKQRMPSRAENRLSSLGASA